MCPRRGNDPASGHPRAHQPPLGRGTSPPAWDGRLDAPGQRRRHLPSSAWTRRREVKQGKSGGSVGTTDQGKGKGRSVVRPMGTVAYRGKGQGKGKGRGEGRLGQGGRGRSKGGEKLMGTTAYGGKGSKGRAANGDRPVGAASCRRDHHTMASCQNPPLQGAQPMPSPCLPDGKRQAQRHLQPTVTAPNRFGNLLQPPVYPLLRPPLGPFPFEYIRGGGCPIASGSAGRHGAALLAGGHGMGRGHGGRAWNAVGVRGPGVLDTAWPVVRADAAAAAAGGMRHKTRAAQGREGRAQGVGVRDAHRPRRASRGGGGIWWAVNWAWEIGRLTLAATFPAPNPGPSPRALHAPCVMPCSLPPPKFPPPNWQGSPPPTPRTRKGKTGKNDCGCQKPLSGK